MGSNVPLNPKQWLQQKSMMAYAGATKKLCVKQFETISDEEIALLCFAVKQEFTDFEPLSDKIAKFVRKYTLNGHLSCEIDFLGETKSLSLKVKW